MNSRPDSARTAFILDGDNRILADERLADPKAREAGVVPLMPLANFGDPVLARYAERKPLPSLRPRTPRFRGRRDRYVETGERGFMPWNGAQDYIAITRGVAGYGERPWTIGAYFAASDIGDEIMRAWLSAMLGLARAGLRGRRGDCPGKAPVAPGPGDCRPGTACRRFRPGRRGAVAAQPSAETRRSGIGLQRDAGRPARLFDLYSALAGGKARAHR